jgi:hypothetical protein
MTLDEIGEEKLAITYIFYIAKKELGKIKTKEHLKIFCKHSNQRQ